MPSLSRYHCAACKESVYNCFVDGVRVPLVFYMVLGQPDDTGPTLDLNAPGVRVPSFVRELMATPVPRVELCVKCLADAFGLELVDAASDPMYDANNDKIPDARQIAEGVDKVEAFHRLHRRVLHAVKLGQGRTTMADLPEECVPPSGN